MSHEMKMCESRNPRNQRLKPASVLVYNKTMGGVDDVDRRIKPYKSNRKTRKWYRKVAFYGLDLCIFNAYTLYKMVPKNHKVKYKDFILELIREIMETYPLERPNVGRKSQTIPISRKIGQHFAMKQKKTNGKNKYTNCFMCSRAGVRKVTAFTCEKCNKPLCIEGKENCFKRFHLLAKLPKVSKLAKSY